MPTDPVLNTEVPGAVAEAAPFVVEAAKEELHYLVGKWKHLDNYQCKHCPYDSLDEETIKDHVFQQHVRPQPTTRPMTAPILDPQGNLIQTIAFDPNKPKSPDYPAAPPRRDGPTGGRVVGEVKVEQTK